MEIKFKSVNSSSKQAGFFSKIQTKLQSHLSKNETKRPLVNVTNIDLFYQACPPFFAADCIGVPFSSYFGVVCYHFLLYFFAGCTTFYQEDLALKLCPWPVHWPLGLLFTEKGKQLSLPRKMPSKMKETTRIEDFHLLKVLGKGAYGKVFQVRKISGSNCGGIFAIKSVNKSRIASSQTDIRHTKAERDVLVQTEHPFVVKLYYAFETKKRLYLVQEFCRGGELFRRMEVERMMLEEHARFYLTEIVCAIEYLHSIDIVYRDLKTENVMLDQDGHVKLIDFGLSKLGMGEGNLTNTFCGTGKSIF